MIRRPAGTRGLTDRRELLGAGLAAASAGALAPAWARAASPPPIHSESQVLARLLITEHKLSESYRGVLATGVLNTIVSGEVSSFLAQEQEHIGALERQVSLRGGTFPLLPPTPAGPAITTASDALNQLMQAERAAEGAYYAAIPQLKGADLVSLATEILASEAQHWTLLSLLAHNGNAVSAVPNAFVQGS